MDAVVIRTNFMSWHTLLDLDALRLTPECSLACPFEESEICSLGTALVEPKLNDWFSGDCRFLLAEDRLTF